MDNINHDRDMGDGGGEEARGWATWAMGEGKRHEAGQLG